ncbi:MAG: hypothetical protein NTZ16_16320, partial [Verrucomicrobia bacterium]|nr:hypothetical protein [Verrucomicrobiota bacterium]
ESLGISNILLKEGIALLLAYKHSTVYSSVVMRDALKLNVPMIDNDIEEVMAIALKVRVLEYLLKRVKMSTKYKDLMINRLISKFSNRGYKYQEYGLDIDSVASVILDLKEKSNEDK